MRVGIFCPLLGGSPGGAERTCAILANELRLEHEVDLVHHAPQPVIGPLSEFTGIDLRRVSERVVPRPVPVPTAHRRGTLGHWRELAARDAPLSERYDLFVAVVHEPPPFCHARVGVLRVLFPLPSQYREWPRRAVPRGTTARIRHVARLAYYGWGWRRRLGGYQVKLANSRFTRDWTRRRWGVDCEVVYPPVDAQFDDAPKTESILSVGRFAVEGNRKQQDLMVDAFRRLGSAAAGWEYVTAGGARNDDEWAFVTRVERLAGGSATRVLVNVPFGDLRRLYEGARIFWHAAGLGQDETAAPERSEHFGASTVEAMAAGCVPVVIRKGGQPEIVEHGVSGFLWDSVEELEAHTLTLMRDEPLRARMAAAARRRAAGFGRDAFCRGVLERAGRHLRSLL
jgi:glycosyltransferase involved in cell wall biosynthesis